MLVIPAIDIKGGRCVRLKQGQMSKETVYSEIPEEMALKWHKAGAERLHLVDLDGAVEGRPVNREVIRGIAGAVPIPIQLGGGIRDMQSVEAYLDLGVYYIILGTVAFKDPEFVTAACGEFPGRIILGIDARKGCVAVEGWTEETDISPLDMATRYEALGISAVVYTDIQRDGMGTGPNVEATKALGEAIEIPVIASGGISGIEDVANLLSAAESGVIGMITGKALYEGTLDLSEAISLANR
ncbi:MAG: 1-(5-phosphoribosyl)-5-[(5-phosphoribosylamino)methylideneamino]imidazole-4-carboxamide isomerase [Deltaproteobacteria bacterium]|nr:1-(5-phosphoribosyl)-5-[(5-phosphoribosylamino)methylideneamino]imidazole-4-carboxamide isomerase [Deltaproteobacteria bacterium]MBW1862187.1 1-(5-phosphoribosyl)-5-[(5-phosphoribosylamino)methylideneamino]imidazole-4-carboxamide isomerase [Deltaproteobacteria bacterium]